jgi:hypothetical protein
VGSKALGKLWFLADAVSPLGTMSRPAWAPNPCVIRKPRAAKNACNPCVAKIICNPCSASEPAEFTEVEAAAYHCVLNDMKAV